MHVGRVLVQLRTDALDERAPAILALNPRRGSRREATDLADGGHNRRPEVVLDGATDGGWEVRPGQPWATRYVVLLVVHGHDGSQPLTVTATGLPAWDHGDQTCQPAGPRAR
ncbi:MAG: hypothetical protein WKF47_13130 [Geodermatophilaceae bacterium]